MDVVVFGASGDEEEVYAVRVSMSALLVDNLVELDYIPCFWEFVVDHYEVVVVLYD